MSVKSRSSQSSGLLKIAYLGEQLLEATSLVAQRDQLIVMVERLVEGRARLWLQENLFRLPDQNEKPFFPATPPTEAMRQVFETGNVVNLPFGSKGTRVAVPLGEKDLILGVLQVSRTTGPAFRKEELDTIESVSSIAAIALIASHRVAVERWRIGQLNLVRKVSAQIANVLEVDELATSVTKLIQQTFKYYYVALFTMAQDSQTLRFRSSASASHKGRDKAVISLEVELGQGLIGRAAQSGEEIICDDVRAEKLYRFIDYLPETLSEVVLPLKIGERVLGVLDVQSNQLKGFHPNDLLVLRALADNIATAIEGARLYEDLRSRADYLAVLADMSKSIASTLDLNILMREVAVLIHERFGFPFVDLFSVHNNRRQIHFVAGSGEHSQSFHGYITDLDDSQGIIPWVARNAQTILANDIRVEERYHPSPSSHANIQSELAVPLAFGDQVIGVLDIQSDKLNAFSEADQLLFEALGDNIATAIHNTDLYQSEQWRRQVAESLREVAGLLSSNIGIEQVLDTILAELTRILPCEISTIWLLDGEQINLAAVRGCCAVQEVEVARQNSTDAAAWLFSALLSDQPIIRKPTDPIGPSGLAGNFNSNYSSIAAPLRVADQPVGVLTLSHSDPGRYGHEAQNMTSTFANYAAVAIENARLYDSAQEQAYASSALLQVAQAVVSLSDLDEILGTIVRIMPILVGVERCIIYLWDEMNEVFYPCEAYGIPDDLIDILWKDEYSPGEFPLLDAVRENNQPVVHRLASEGSMEVWTAIIPSLNDNIDSDAIPSGTYLLVAYPLAIKSDLFGVMLVEEAVGGHRFRSRRTDIITGITQQAALAIQNDRLQQEMVVRERLEHEIQLARQIQQSFIPDHLPTYPDWELAGLWRPARQVGGDFYDVIELPGQQLGLFIADVADKGIPAALFMALTRTLVRAAVLETQSPAEALSRVNELLIPNTQQGMFVTAVYAVLCLATGKFTYANAGHNPPFWVQKSTGRAERLTRTSMALGVIDKIEIEQRTIQLEPDDCVLFYTDGVTEAFSPDDDIFGETRLSGVVTTLPVMTVTQMLEAIDEAVKIFMDSLPASDDITMLAIRRLGGF
jgi:serine phosphatase RsbU (regulator of sigma subunit)/putative methionine-R-sulfoxide reductase with GAF domain